jgi:hypothetical protein
MILLNAEEPIQPNNSLYSVDDTTGSVGLANFGFNKLKRYRMRFRSRDELQTCAEALMATGANPTWVAVWSEKLGEYTFAQRARVVRSVLSRAGWSVSKFDDLQYACAGVGSAEVSQFGFAHEALRLTQVFLVSNIPDGMSIVNLATYASLYQLSQQQRLAPSYGFLYWLEQQNCSLFYMVKTENTDVDGVLVSNLRPNIECYLDNN